jgi:hypothetical protein
MRMTAANPTWVVYAVPTTDPSTAPKAVCTATEWAVLERDRPGVYFLVRSGIPTEPEAERLARGSAGADEPRRVRPSPFARAREVISEPNSIQTAAAG